MREYERSGIVTPAYVFDAEGVRSRVEKIRSALGEKRKICFAVKANPFFVEELMGTADFFEVCSPGEYDICRLAGIPAEKTVLSGVYKAETDVRRVIEECGSRAVYTAESISQAKLLCRLAREKHARLPVLLRLSSGNQFGMDDKTVLEILKKSKSLDIAIIGVQFYSGTQKRLEAVIKEIEKLKTFAEEAELAGMPFKRIEYGPGLRVNYFDGEEAAEEDSRLRAFAKMLDIFPEQCEIVLEMGRFIAAECGEYCTRIVDTKQTRGNHFCIVDGGIHHLNYYGQMMGMKHPFLRHLAQSSEQSGISDHGATKNDERAEEAPWMVCGSLCTSADVLVKNLPLQNVGTGDMLVFEKAGAYSVTEGIGLFLSRKLPRVYKVADDGSLVLLRDFLETSKINRKGVNV